MVFYKMERSSLQNKEMQRLLDRVNPFAQLFGYAPVNPLRMADLFQQMLRNWQSASRLEKLHTKALLYQAIREIYGELRTGSVAFLQPDPVVSTKRYLDEHYTSPLPFEEMADRFAISRGQLTRLFKKRVGMSLQEYLTLKRLEKARDQLTHTQATIKEVALGCGMGEELNLIRLFKKHYRMTPSEYRNKMIACMHDYDIDNHYQQLYNEEGSVGLVKSQRDGEFTMFGQGKSKEMILAAAMSLMLILSACTSNAPANNGGAASPAASPTQSAAIVEKNGKEAVAKTRTVTTIMGDIEVPLNPERVVVNWYVGEVLAAGLNVVGYSSWAQETMPFYTELMAMTKIDNWEPENVMTLDPDLIVTYSPDDFDKFGKVAPVLVIAESLPSPDKTKFIGEAAGTIDTANENITAFETKLAAAKEIFKADAFTGKTFSIMEDWGPSGEWSGVAYETGSRGGTLVYQYLGLQYPDKLAELIASTSQGRGTLSYEVAHEYFGDYIIWFQQEGKPSAYAETDIWASIPAVANNRVLEIPGKYQGLFYYDDVLSLTAQLDYLVEALNRLAE